MTTDQIDMYPAPAQHSDAAPSLDFAAIAAGGIGGQFGRFAGGVGSRRNSIVQADNVAGEMDATIAIPTVNGEPIGVWRNGALWVKTAQLRMAPREDLLCSFYEPGSEPKEEFERRKAAIVQLGDGYDPLPITLSTQGVEIQGRIRPIFLILDRPEVWAVLLDLKRTEIKVDYVPPTTKQGVGLYRALASSEYGLLRLKPSLQETCRAVKRLVDCGFTYAEVGQVMANLSADGSRPSDAVLSTMYRAAALPEVAQDLHHRGVILWTHIKSIVNAWGKLNEDPVVAERLAILAGQDGQMATREFDQAIRRLEEGITTLALEGERINEVEMNPSLHLVPAGKRGQATAVPIYSGMMATSAIHIQRAAASYHVTLIPDEQAVTPDTVQPLLEYLASHRGNFPIAELEPRLTGFLQAIREEGMRTGCINKQGVIAPTVDQKPNRAGGGAG
jgi:hypothetical protein